MADDLKRTVNSKPRLLARTELCIRLTLPRKSEGIIGVDDVNHGLDFVSRGFVFVMHVQRILEGCLKLITVRCEDATYEEEIKDESTGETRSG